MLASMDPIFGTDYKLIRYSTNRTNIMYATHEVVGGLDDVRNYECFLTQPYDPIKQPRVLIFFQSMKLACEVADHLDSLLPSERQQKGITEHYYSDMSEDFLARTFVSFTSKQGTTKILCSTSGNSTGVDFPDVDIVCVAGMPDTLTDVSQCFGRGGRKQGSHSLAVLFYEPWVSEISLDEFEGRNADLSDPDRTREPLNVKSKVRDRAVLSCVRLAQMKENECQRAYFASSNGDESPEATDYVTEYCCSTHPDRPLVLSTHLPSPLFTIARLEEEKKKPPEKKTRNQYRKPAQREGLDNRLIAWIIGIITSHDVNVNHGFRYMEDILSTTNRKRLVMTIPGPKTSSAKAIQDLLEESDEWNTLWGEAVYQLVTDYDNSLKTTKRKRNVVSDSSDDESVSSLGEEIQIDDSQGYSSDEAEEGTDDDRE
ncbi:hypothetical protein NMY22_g12731 [Coprinellus aureogranulatus]|nr:hypothetical protein NMY22_g12731 [Coprinellus aureogranulatus]